MSDNPFSKLKSIIKDLRDKDTGCPWDIKQTHESLKPYLVEETYETLDAIDNKPENLSEELGDVLLQVMLHSQIASEAGTFSIEDVIETLNEKLIRRHPHVFGDVAVSDADEVVKNWKEIKESEKSSQDRCQLEISYSLPALVQTHEIGKAASKVGFDWEGPQQVLQKLKEEIAEYEQALVSDKDGSKPLEELGDALFTLAHVIRLRGSNAEAVLTGANQKFLRRFNGMTKLTARPLKELSFDELHKLWDKVKAAELD